MLSGVLRFFFSQGQKMYVAVYLSTSFKYVMDAFASRYIYLRHHHSIFFIYVYVTVLDTDNVFHPVFSFFLTVTYWCCLKKAFEQEDYLNIENIINCKLNYTYIQNYT